LKTRRVAIFAERFFRVSQQKNIGKNHATIVADNRPLLQPGKQELRCYTAIYMLKDKEVGQFSNDLVINCAPGKQGYTGSSLRTGSGCFLLNFASREPISSLLPPGKLGWE